MKRLGIINSEYLFKTIENSFFVEITIFNAIKKRIEAKKESKDSKGKTKPKARVKKAKKKRYPVIYSRHALLFNGIIYILFVLTSAMVMTLKSIGKLTLIVYKFIKNKTKCSKETICTEDTVSSSDDGNIDYSNVIDLQPILVAKSLDQSKKVLPQ